MHNQDQFDDLQPWQKAFVQREALAICRSNQCYAHLEDIVEGDDHDLAVHADAICWQMRQNAMDEVLADDEFMESITVAEEDRYMTRGNNHVR